jgi:hypothetical protein
MVIIGGEHAASATGNPRLCVVVNQQGVDITVSPH